MYSKQKLACLYLCIYTCSSILPVLCYPSLEENSNWQPIGSLETRKFAEKPNPPKKATSFAPIEDRNDLEDVNTNQIPQDNGNTFSWGNVITTLMQMFFNTAGATGPSKSDSLDTDQTAISTSPWANLLSVGLKIITAFLGGGQVGTDGIDKVDNGSPYQGILTAVLSAFLGTKNEDQAAKVAQQAGEFVNIIVQLLDTLRQSFGHRFMAARSLGKKDSISEATVAGLTFVKGYFRTMRTANPSCVQKIICEASKECADSLNQPNAISCQLGTSAASSLIRASSSVPYESLLEAGRQGRNAKSAEECSNAYSSCVEN